MSLPRSELEKKIDFIENEIKEMKRILLHLKHPFYSNIIQLPPPIVLKIRNVIEKIQKKKGEPITTSEEDLQKYLIDGTLKELIELKKNLLESKLKNLLESKLKNLKLQHDLIGQISDKKEEVISSSSDSKIEVPSSGADSSSEVRELVRLHSDLALQLNSLFEKPDFKEIKRETPEEIEKLNILFKKAVNVDIRGLSAKDFIQIRALVGFLTPTQIEELSFIDIMRISLFFEEQIKQGLDIRTLNKEDALVLFQACLDERNYEQVKQVSHPTSQVSKRVEKERKEEEKERKVEIRSPDHELHLSKKTEVNDSKNEVKKEKEPIMSEEEARRIVLAHLNDKISSQSSMSKIMKVFKNAIASGQDNWEAVQKVIEVIEADKANEARKGQQDFQGAMDAAGAGGIERQKELYRKAQQENDQKDFKQAMQAAGIPFSSKEIEIQRELLRNANLSKLFKKSIDDSIASSVPVKSTPRRSSKGP